jgi:hypothetical protein
MRSEIDIGSCHILITTKPTHPMRQSPANATVEPIPFIVWSIAHDTGAGVSAFVGQSCQVASSQAIQYVNTPATSSNTPTPNTAANPVANRARLSLIPSRRASSFARRRCSLLVKGRLCNRSNNDCRSCFKVASRACVSALTDDDDAVDESSTDMVWLDTKE